MPGPGDLEAHKPPSLGHCQPGRGGTVSKITTEANIRCGQGYQSGRFVLLCLAYCTSIMSATFICVVANGRFPSFLKLNNILDAPINIRNLKKSREKQRVEWWLPGAGEKGQWVISIKGYIVSLMKDELILEHR